MVWDGRLGIVMVCFPYFALSVVCMTGSGIGSGVGSCAWHDGDDDEVECSPSLSLVAVLVLVAAMFCTAASVATDSIVTAVELKEDEEDCSASIM